MTIITQPGVYADLPNDEYHADPVPSELGGSLSSSGARRLLPPSCPAKFRWNADHGQAPTDVFDFGHAAHGLALGDGPELVKVDAADWRTKAAKEAREAARTAGKVALLPEDYAAVHAMAKALREHPIATRLFSDGLPEQSLFWVDEWAGVWRRARLDWLPNGGRGRPIIPDYKSTRSADPDAISKHLADYGYDLQAAWYLDAVRALLGADDAAFVFVFQEKDPPYLVTVVEPDPIALEIGRDKARRAIDLFAECTESGSWPGYSDDIELIGLPAWAQRRHYQETA